MRDCLRGGIRGGGSTFSTPLGATNFTSRRAGMAGMGATGDWTALGAEAIKAAAQIAGAYAPQPTTTTPQPTVVYQTVPSAPASNNTMLYVGLGVLGVGLAGWGIYEFSKRRGGRK